MQQENTRRLIRNIAVVGGIVVAVFLIFFIIRQVFFMPSSRPDATELTDPIVNTSSDRGVKMTIRGPIVAAENARAYDVDVTPSSRSVTLYSGYDGSVVSKQMFANSTSAYEQFVYALNKAGMTNERNTSATDTRGVCASGRLYTFALERDTTIESSLWSSSCSGSRGTLNASPTALRALFDAQIPEISKYRGNL